MPDIWHKPVKIKLIYMKGEKEHEKPIVVERRSFRDADSAIRLWALASPKMIGYHRCDFEVTYDNEEVYKGEFQIMFNHSMKSNILGAYMYKEISFCAGKWKPKHMSDDQYKFFMNEWIKDKQTKYEGFLEHYEIGY